MPDRRMPMSWLVGGCLPSLGLGLAASLGGCGDSTAAESGATRIVRVDERKGSVQGVRLGDSLSEVKRRLPGGVEADPRTSRTLPLVGELEELGLPGIAILITKAPVGGANVMLRCR